MSAGRWNGCLGLLVCLFAFTAPAHAGCALPVAPSKVPDGATASDEEMSAAMATMADFETDVNNYLKCLEFEVKQGRLPAEEKAHLANEALDRHQAAVTRFNAQTKAYMAR